MCLCTEARRRGISFVDFAEAVGAPVEALREWENRTPCWCAKMPVELLRESAKLIRLWLVCFEQEEIRRAG